MTPYARKIETDRYTLYEGDCLAILPTLASGSVDAVVTDPPWKASASARTNGRAGTRTGVAKNRSDSLSVVYGDIGHFDASAIHLCCDLSAADVLVLCGYIELREVISAVGTLRGVFTWHNTRPTPIPGPVHARDAAYIVWGGKRTLASANGSRWRSCVFHHHSPQAGCFATERLTDRSGKSLHPAQEPIALFEELMAPLGESICDPYMGTGTTGAACLKHGRRFVGIELNPKYFDIAHRRIEEAANHLFAAVPS